MRKKKILITGILGYISRGICEILKDQYEIIGFDNNFLPDKVAWLVENGIKFYQKDLLECKELLTNDINVIIHTAGITVVPMTLKDSNPEIDEKITKVGTIGTRYLLENCSKNSKIIFLSTHCVFDSLDKELENIEENFPVCPLVAYSKSKATSEKDIINSGLNYTILRLASVYGYNPNIRWRILPNLFSKMAALNQQITIFGSGKNKKPVVALQDVCNLIHYFIDNDSKNIYHVASEHFTVEEIAKICQKYNSLAQIKYTNDEIPNLGYTISNNKILSTGFQFRQNLDSEIENMVKIWSNNGTNITKS